MADVNLPDGWIALPGGNVYNPSTNQILTQSQAAYAFSVPQPERFLTPPTPTAQPTPTYSMDENGNIGAAYDPAYSYSLNQANQGYGMLNDQLAAKLTAQNPYGMAPVTVQGVAPQTTYAAPPAPPAVGTPEWINWIMGQAQQPTQPVAPQVSPPNGVDNIRSQVGGDTQAFPTASGNNSGTSMLGWNNGTSLEAPTNSPQFATVQDTSAWRAAPAALTPLQQGGRGMLYS
jgi:hypothetical protein